MGMEGNIPEGFQQWAKNIFVAPLKDVEETNSLVFTYRKFASPSQLFQLWTNKVKEVDESDTKSLSNMMEFLFIWFQKSYYLDFPRGKERAKILGCIDTVFPCRRNEFKLFALRMNRNRGNIFSYAKRGNRMTFKLNAGLKGFQNENMTLGLQPVFQSSTDSLGSTSSTTSSYLDDDSLSSSLKNVELPPFMKIPTDSMAQAFTLDASSLFLNLQPIEFLSKTGWNSHMKTSTRHLDALIAKFNELSSWVTTEIVTQGNRTVQTELTERIIRIAKKCEMMNNFESCLALLSGLNSFAVQRLKTLWNSISEKAKGEFKSLENLMSPSNNFKKYVEELNIRKGAKVPYIGLLIRDFTFLNENELIRDGKLNDEAIKLVGKRIAYVKELQIESYEPLVDPVSILSFFKPMKLITNEEELYEWSLHSEPSSSLWTPVPDEFYHPEESESNTETSFSETKSESGLSIESEPIFTSFPSPSPYLSPSLPSPSHRTSFSGIRLSTGSIEELRSREKTEKEKEKKEKVRKRRESSVCLFKDEFRPILTKMEHSAESFFNGATNINKYKGTIHTAGHRSLLIRHNSIGVDFVQESRELFQVDREEDRNSSLERFSYDFWYSVGKNDFKTFKNDIQREEERDLIVSGLIFTAYQGWNRVQLVDGNLNKENFFMQVNATRHDRGSGPGSCWAFAGYLSGWTTGAYSSRINACEIACGSDTDGECTFILAPRDTIQRHIDSAIEKLGLQKGKTFAPPSPRLSDKSDKATKKEKGNYLAQGLSKLKSKQLFKSHQSSFPDTAFEIVPQVEGRCIEVEAGLFGNINCDPAEGTVRFERRPDGYVFVRGGAMSVELVEHFKAQFEAEKADPIMATRFAAQLVTKFGMALGKADVKSLGAGERIPTAFLKAHFLTYSMRNGGWGKASIMPATTIRINSQKKLEHVCIRCNVYNGFESEAWITSGKSMKAANNALGESPTCLLTSGYISGWMTEAFASSLECVEVSCRKRGHDCCTFLVTPKAKMEDEVKKYLSEINNPAKINDIMTLALLRMGDQSLI